MSDSDRPFKLVECSFRTDGSGQLYTYKIPEDWNPSISQRMKVPAKEGGWKAVTIMKLGGTLLPAVEAKGGYKFGFELIEDDFSEGAQAAPKPPLDTNPNGAPIGADLAKDLNEQNTFVTSGATTITRFDDPPIGHMMVVNGMAYVFDGKIYRKAEAWDYSSSADL